MKVKVSIFALGAMLAVTMPALAQKTAGEVLDDADIAATIKAGLLDNKDTHATRINVDSYKGVVQLSGFAESEAEKEAAAKVAHRVAGVREVKNDIAIGPKTTLGTKLDDSLTTGKVKAALMDASEIKSMEIKVETRNGVTQLAGFVSSEAMKERAGKLAASIEGVRQVDNALRVRPR